MTLLDQFAEHLLRQLRVHGAERAPLLAAVSGGADSTALALGLAHLRQSGALPQAVSIGHVDHGAHPESSAGAAFVDDLGRRLHLATAHRALRLGSSASEATLRAGRYDALHEMAEAAGAASVLTAHHADDQLETVLFRALRGAGPRGLAGIPACRPLALPGRTTGLRVVRPMLALRRVQIEELLAALGERPAVDPTNRDLRFSRNRIRVLLLPQLRASDAGIERRLFELAARAQTLAERLDQDAGAWLALRQTRPTAWRVELAAESRDRGPVVTHAIQLIAGELRDEVPWAWIERTAALLDCPAGLRVGGPRGLLAERTRGGLLIVDPDRAGAPPTHALALPTSAQPVRFGSTEWRITAHLAENAPIDNDNRWRAVLDANAIDGPLCLRRRAPGDRFHPLGGSAPVDLRRFVQNRHLTRYDRDRLPLVGDAAGRVVWIPGIEVAEFARRRDSTGPRLVLTASTLPR